MQALADNPRAVIGANNPPEEMTAFEAVKINITDLYDEAKLWLDGDPVTTQEQADAVNTLKDSVKKAAAAAEAERKKEVNPLNEQINDIQARYNELIGKNKSITGLAIKAEEACNAALKPYLIELDRQQQEKARLAREEADRKQAEAIAAMLARNAANLAQREDAEKLVTEAKAAEALATKAEGAKAHARGDGRATGLRTVWKAEVVDERLAASWLWVDHRDAVMDLATRLASDAVRHGSRKIPGFNVFSEQVL